MATGGAVGTEAGTVSTLLPGRLAGAPRLPSWEVELPSWEVELPPWEVEPPSAPLGPVGEGLTAPPPCEELERTASLGA